MNVSPRRVGVAGLICFAAALVAAFGWGAHWNAYTCLTWTLGDGVLWTTLYVAVRPRHVTIRATAPSGVKIPAIKAIRAATGLGLREAKDATEGSGLVLRREVALPLAVELRKIGVTVEVHRGEGKTA